jgi:hypothetical protein
LQGGSYQLKFTKVWLPPNVIPLASTTQPSSQQLPTTSLPTRIPKPHSAPNSPLFSHLVHSIHGSPSLSSTPQSMNHFVSNLASHPAPSASLHLLASISRSRTPLPPPHPVPAPPFTFQVTLSSAYPTTRSAEMHDISSSLMHLFQSAGRRIRRWCGTGAVLFRSG